MIFLNQNLLWSRASSFVSQAINLKLGASSLVGCVDFKAVHWKGNYFFWGKSWEPPSFLIKICLEQSPTFKIIFSISFNYHVQVGQRTFENWRLSWIPGYQYTVFIQSRVTIFSCEATKSTNYLYIVVTHKYKLRALKEFRVKKKIRSKSRKNHVRGQEIRLFFALEVRFHHCVFGVQRVFGRFGTLYRVFFL